jgi:hypothetical protein
MYWLPTCNKSCSEKAPEYCDFSSKRSIPIVTSYELLQWEYLTSYSVYIMTYLKPSDVCLIPEASSIITKPVLLFPQPTVGMLTAGLGLAYNVILHGHGLWSPTTTNINCRCLLSILSSSVNISHDSLSHHLLQTLTGHWDICVLVYLSFFSSLA